MKQDAQAIVLAAGPGSRMGSVGFRAKCLLPVGNYPMIYYPLKLLQETGFEEATVIINQKDEGEIKKIPEVYNLKIRLDLVPIDTSRDPGTAESLLSIENKVKKNVEEVVIISSDLITDVSLLGMINFHMGKGLALTVLTANQNTEYIKATPPGPKSKPNYINDLFCLNKDTLRLKYFVAGGDYEDIIKLKKKINVSPAEKLSLLSNLVDGHLYIIKRWVFDYIFHKESECALMSSLKAELIPHLIVKQYTTDRGLERFVKKIKFEDLIVKYNTSTIESRFRSNVHSSGSLCYAYHHPGLCVRVNTLGTLWLINRKINRIYDSLKMEGQKYVKGNDEGISERAQICDQTMIGRSIQIADKTNISNCLLGHHCRINSFVRLSNSVLFDYVQIEEGCVIENSLICVNIEKKCIIKNCVVTDVSKISENKTYENEWLEKGLSQDFSY